MIRLILKTTMKQTYVDSMEYSDTNIVESHDTHDNIHKRYPQIFEYLRQFVHISFFLPFFIVVVVISICEIYFANRIS